MNMTLRLPSITEYNAKKYFYEIELMVKFILKLILSLSNQEMIMIGLSLIMISSL